MLRDVALAQYASLTEVLLKSGAQLPEVMGMISKLEEGSAIESDLKKIEQNLAAGQSSYQAASNDCKVIPGFFNWIVSQAGENVTVGFSHAHSIYSGRAENKIQSFLYCFLPINILLIGFLLLGFFIPQMSFLTDAINFIDKMGL